MSNKKYVVVGIVVLFVLFLSAWYLWANKQGVSMLDVLKTADQNTQTLANWDDIEEVFNINIPDDFDTDRLTKLEEKITNAKELYETKKEDTWTWITIGNMYEFAHDYDRAIGAYEKAASLNELEYISRMNLAYLYENQKKDYPEAEKYYKKVIEINGTNPDQYVNLARFYEFKTNQPGEAEKIYVTGLEETFNNPDLLVATIRFYERQNNTGKAGEYARELLTLYPDNETYRNDFGALVK